MLLLHVDILNEFKKSFSFVVGTTKLVHLAIVKDFLYEKEFISREISSEFAVSLIVSTPDKCHDAKNNNMQKTASHSIKAIGVIT